MKVERLLSGDEAGGDESAGAWAAQWRSLRPAALLLAASLGGTALLGVVAPRPAATMAVIGAPWWDAPRMAEIAVTAGARLVDAGRFDNVLIVRRAEGEEIDLAAALYSAGAWLVLDAAGPRGCLAGFSG